jgi:hypothetical protein
MIEPGGRTIRYEILELINSMWNREENLNSRNSRSVSLSYRKGDGQGVVTTKALLCTPCCLNSILFKKQLAINSQYVCDTRLHLLLLMTHVVERMLW